MSKACIYCELNSKEQMVGSHEGEMYIESNAFTGQPYMYDEYSGLTVDIHFCPICGRDLKEDEDEF